MVIPFCGNHKELPKEFNNKKRKVHSVHQGFIEKEKVTLVSSHVKKGKIVNVLSTTHTIQKNVKQDGSKKPDVIDFYYSTKGGVDKVDQMCRLYTTKAACRRWPVHVF